MKKLDGQIGATIVRNSLVACKTASLPPRVVFVEQSCQDRVASRLLSGGAAGAWRFFPPEGEIRFADAAAAGGPSAQGVRVLLIQRHPEVLTT